MKSVHTNIRPGITLVELLLFVAIMGMMAATILPMLFNSTESRQRQDAIALVEQNGAQVISTVINEVRSAERVLYPPVGSSSTVLALQTQSGSTNPTIIALHSGAVVMVQGREKRILSSSIVGATAFTVDNTSTSDDFQSVAVGVGLRRIIRLHQPLIYRAYFDSVINVFPDNETVGDSCNCVVPYCDSDAGSFIWEMCLDGVCVAQGGIDCI